MASQIQIIEKPDWISWEDIKQCLVAAHATNRNNGVNMEKYQWPVDKIRQSIGMNGVILVALDGGKVIGSAAVGEKKDKKWYAKNGYAYMCLACVLPEYRGQGIYKKLIQLREDAAKVRGYDVLVLDTHKDNKKIQNIAKLNNYRKVGYFRTKDHYNVVMAKWQTGCPYPEIYCRFRFYLSWIRAHLVAYYHAVKIM